MTDGTRTKPRRKKKIPLLKETKFQELISPTTGRIWMDRNIGAYRHSISKFDAYSFGDLFQYGRQKDGHEWRYSNIKKITTENSTVVDRDKQFFFDQNWHNQPEGFWNEDGTGINDDWPRGWRIPTKEEWEAEIEGFEGNNKQQEALLKLGLPCNGVRSMAGINFQEGLSGYYYCIGYTMILGMISITFEPPNYRNGCGVRLIKINEPEGSIISPQTNRIWMDRNMGASRVATSVSDTQAYGDLYQRGRRTDGHEKRNSLTTATKATTNIADTDRFITGSGAWTTTGTTLYWNSTKTGLNDIWPDGFRVPTTQEWLDEFEGTSNFFFTRAFGLKITTGGRRSNAGQFSSVGQTGIYYTSDGNSFVINSQSISVVPVTDAMAGAGRSVRLIKE